MLDKGVNVVNKNWVEGKQRTAQPVFRKSNHTFKGRNTLDSGSVISLQSGTERQVNVSKRPGYIKEGFECGMDPAMFDDVWLCRVFQANFMYNPML